MVWDIYNIAVPVSLPHIIAVGFNNIDGALGYAYPLVLDVLDTLVTGTWAFIGPNNINAILLHLSNRFRFGAISDDQGIGGAGIHNVVGNLAVGHMGSPNKLVDYIPAVVIIKRYQ